MNDRSYQLVVAALVAALLAVSAWVTLPLGAVPVTLQAGVVVLAGLLLPPGTAAAAVGGYVLLGAFGLPVFSGMRGGLHVLAGPTGGYLVGFVIGAVGASLIRERLAARFPRATDAVAAAACLLGIYAPGWAWLALSSGMGAAPAFWQGVAVFLPVDALKAAAAVVLAGAVRRAGARVARREAG